MLGIFHSTIRGDEKLIIKACKRLGVEFELYDIRKLVLEPENFKVSFDIALNRSVSNTKGRYLTFFLESFGVEVINSSKVLQICEDKFLTSLALRRAGVPTVDFLMVFSLEQAKEAVERLGGYPVVIKSPLGSWGRFMAKVNDEEALEAVIELKMGLQAPYHKAFYIQKYIDKGGRDIRAFVIGGRTICAIYRNSSHWITNTARGGVATNCPVDKDLAEICRRASEAVGGGILAMDLFETRDGYVINEINHTMEFKNSEKPTGVSISEEIVKFCIEKLKAKK